ncbi:LacI family transcriptional regulator [Pullulanibacillus pueri]|uniref:Transcriptional regulator LacI/GalR-like sensor domain-containing protein n=2 Tax=Pullulanibacillus pueri TaxID=1437324 RepID=A0A8J2ZYQ7_9BACL|nr:LacI family transcriptional regulator [Pullulanibacillus pueri]GGH86340.1 hypothetical protein GCM10007096_33820 [Pullulanibacillus pueri]
MHLFIESISHHTAEKLVLPSLLNNLNIDGLLILSHLPTEYISKVLSTGIPSVLIDHHDPHFQADSILINNRFGAYNAVEHLIQLGHKDIAFVGDIEFSPSYEERLEGYLLALRKHNISPNKNFIFSSAKEKEEEIEQFITALSEQPTAWFCVNDGHGFLVSSRLKQMGLNIPGQVSVCSFDNGQLSQIATPKITTVDIDLKHYGKKAVEQLFQRIENPNKPFEEILISTQLLVRESTAIRVKAW